jgi:hypothetical protein
LIVVSTAFANIPNQFKYQAVIRDAKGNIMRNESVKIEIALLECSVSGDSVFVEKQNTVTRPIIKQSKST